MNNTPQNKPHPPKNANFEGSLATVKHTLRTILSTAQERHVFLIGICEVLCPWRPHFQPPNRRLRAVKKEWHYYVAGRAIAVIIWLVILYKLITHLL